MADLAGLLALLGIDYGSDASLTIARALAAILRGRAEAASGALARLFGTIAPATLDWPAPPAETPLPAWPRRPCRSAGRRRRRMDCATSR